MTALPVGIQLYTVAAELKADFRGTLRAIAAIGFQGVEFAWTYGDLAPTELADLLAELNLACCGFYELPDNLENPASPVYDYARALKTPFVTTGLSADENGSWEPSIARASRIASVVQSLGFQFTYHNHWQEFERIDGQYVLDALLERTDPDLVKAEVDVGWAIKGGADPVACLERHAGRVPQVHLRDIAPDTLEITDIGTGALDVARVFETARRIGTQWMIYEQDRFPVSALDSARACAAYLTRQGLW